MKHFPEHINKLIMSYVYKCKKENMYILNKEYKRIYLDITKDCDKIFVLRKYLCNKCDKKKVVRFRMILNNLLPG